MFDFFFPIMHFEFPLKKKKKKRTTADKTATQSNISVTQKWFATHQLRNADINDRLEEKMQKNY